MPREITPNVPCHHVKIGADEWVHIPGCYGALHDPACCTCYPRGSELEEAIIRRDEAERYIERLLDAAHQRTQRLNAMFHRNRKLFEQVQRLKALTQNTE